MNQKVKTAQQERAAVFDCLDIYAASSPYWPEMLDFDLDENAPEEQREIAEYLNHFGANS